MQTNKVYIAFRGNAVFVRIIGRGSFQNSHPIKKILTAKLESGCSKILIDLAECSGMDSTFMGMVTGMSLKMKNADKEMVYLSNVSSHNIRLLETLGLNKFLNIIDQQEADNSIAWELLPLESTDKLSITKHMLEAHEQLIDTGTLASEQFKSVHKMLKEDLEKQLKKTDKKK